jgi:hypothetical protein
VPVHDDDYGAFRSPLADFTRAAAASPWAQVVTPVRRGQTGRGAACSASPATALRTAIVAAALHERTGPMTPSR